MAKELFNDAERFLLDEWEQARILEESMEGVRGKYKELFQRTSEAVIESHPEFDASASYPTQFWGSGSIGFGRKRWPTADANWPSGFWIWSLRLENLVSDQEFEPYATVYVPTKAGKKVNLDVIAAKDRLINAAAELLSADELKGTDRGDTNEVLLYLPAPTKSEVLSLLRKGDGQDFIARFVAQFDLMARFVPVLDTILSPTAGEK